MNVNTIMLGLLNSPVHGMLSRNMMSVTVTGRKSGKQYTTPVNYAHETMADGSERYWTLSDRERTWWRNLRGGAPATLLIKRTPIAVEGHTIEEPAAVEETLKHFLELSPGMARFMRVPKQNGVLDAAALKEAGQRHVIVCFTPQAVGPSRA